MQGVVGWECAYLDISSWASGVRARCCCHSLRLRARLRTQCGVSGVAKVGPGGARQQCRLPFWSKYINLNPKRGWPSSPPTHQGDSLASASVPHHPARSLQSREPSAGACVRCSHLSLVHHCTTARVQVAACRGGWEGVCTLPMQIGPPRWHGG